MFAQLLAENSVRVSPPAGPRSDPRDPMHYFVTLNGREFSLSARRDGGQYLVQGAQGEGDGASLEVEILSRGEQCRPALVRVNGRVYRILLGEPAASGDRALPVRIDGLATSARIETELERRARPIRNKASASTAQVRAPMPGRVVKISVREGETVSVGSALLSIEAMKMENELSSPSAGRVHKVLVSVGATVEAEQELLVIEPL
jgi:biotin carboxyl carrier protein